MGSFDLADVAAAAAQGLPTGAIWGLIAIALVVARTTSGVLNLAFAAQAYAAAVCFTGLREGFGWPGWLAAVVSIGVLSPLGGVVLERFLLRPLARSDDLTRLVTVLGVLVAGPAMVDLVYDAAEVTRPDGLAPDSDWLLRAGPVVLDVDQIASLVATGAVAIIAWVVLGRTGWGLRAKAVAESRRMSELHGVDADRVARGAWAASSTLAGLAGVLLLPDVLTLDDQRYVLLLLGGLAAAAIGDFTKVWIALLGGLGLGALQGGLVELLPPGGGLANGVRPSMPFIALFVALLARWRTGTDDADPLADVDPPRSVRGLARPGQGLTRGIGLVSSLAAVLLVVVFADAFWLGLASRSVALAIALLSLTLLTGTGGMISLCQVSFMTIGAFTVARSAQLWGLDVITASVLGALLAAIVGAAVALPALRLGGFHLGLATLAFALAFEQVVVQSDWINGGASRLVVPRPVLGGLDLTDDTRWFLFLVVVLALVAATVGALRRGQFGRRLVALRTSEVGLRSVGIDPVWLKLATFALSAGIAGFGGGLLAIDRQSVNTIDTVWFLGLVYLVLLAGAGVGSIGAGVVAGVGFYLVPELLARASAPPGAASVLFGLGALGYARFPDGWVPALAERLERLATRPS